ncbi:RNA 2',3'-cyclic phosphodiesterase [Streptomyces sp. XD-27]|uniref:RNA 2',3'-cyclic phosphodiesterase n=1 Tax=Streptomyces sp. XD-27 TaxID=3062779 RepID=UPI0026F47967|nr:RNA 2',3'-cyclic phosphodiesterase [Streptomyces sp. XD-27]WKX71013.1 RNA 2',3'-cyclic phosphodiesterase [Streptomyces sp. XD-27]
MRLFAAVLPPDDVLAELGTAVDPLHRMPGAEQLRWADRTGWHFTLAFYGEVAEELLPELHERLARAAQRHAPYELCLARGGRFGHRVMWVGADGDRTAMRRLADAAAAGARRAGVEMKDDRPYDTPHLTIARSRGRRPEVDMRPFVAALAEFASVPWTAGELTLMRSHPPVAGVAGAQPRYEAVGRWPLGR